MSNSTVVYSNGNLKDTDGEISIGHHTDCLYTANVDSAHWVEIKLNGGPISIWVPDANSHQHVYMKVPGDYTKIQVMTASSTVSVYAVG